LENNKDLTKYEKHGVLKGRCRTDQLQKCFHAEVETTRWENDPVVTLRYVAKNLIKEKVMFCTVNVNLVALMANLYVSKLE